MEIRFSNHLRAVPFLIATVVTFLGLLWWVNFDPPAVIIFASWTALISLPALFLHIEYWTKNAGETIDIYNDRIVVRRKGGQVLEYKREELKGIIVYKSASAERDGIPLSPMEYYFYARVLTIDKQSDVIITSLMDGNFEREISKLTGMKVEKRRTFFASLKYPFVLLRL